VTDKLARVGVPVLSEPGAFRLYAMLGSGDQATTLLYPDADDPLRRERLMLHVTDMMGGLLGFAAEAPYDLLNARPVIDLGLADNAKFVASLPSLPDRLDDALQAFA